MISVVIPAYNEENYLPATLAAVGAAIEGIDAEIIVVDNASTDRTAEIATSFGATLVTESEHNIARVRNAGGRVAKGDVIVFVDADTIVPAGLFNKIANLMKDPKCIGGSVGVGFKWADAGNAVKRQYIRLCLWVGRLIKIRMGALQFCTRQAFDATGGYDETIYVGEDGEFQYRLERYAAKQGCHTTFIKEPKVLSSARRFEKVGLLRLVFMYHPVTIFLLWRRASLWKDWYENAIR